MSAERIKIIQETIAKAQALKLQTERQRLAFEETRKAAEKAQREAIIAQNEARLRATGIVQYFEQLRDNKVVVVAEPVFEERRRGFFQNRLERVKIREAMLALINFEGEDHEKVVLSFDRYSVDHHSNYDLWCSEEYHRITAQVMSDGRLAVNEEVVDNNLDEVVTRAILEAKGLVIPSSK